MKLKRSSGIILHPTSLPGPYGIGDLGPEAFRWIDFLTDAGCALWQVLPLGPTGYGDSPYQCFSAFAGNPLLISPQMLLSEDLLHSNDLVDAPNFLVDYVDYGAVIDWKLGVLDRAYIRFQQSAPIDVQTEFADFRIAEQDWLDDFSLFMALKEAHGGVPWVSWEQELRDRNPRALVAASQKFEVAIQRQAFRQFLFTRQWRELRNYARDRGLQIIGDVPIFVAHDSSDVWANPDLFYLDQSGHPTVIAGVPPDYFSPTGQLWGNPLYRWDVHKESNYKWWIDRIRAVLERVDIIRLDHFRGFAGYWEIPGDAKTAEKGRWVPAPGMDFFETLVDSFGELPFIAEDLGVITPDVMELRAHFGFPGMRILQFGFEGGPQDSFLPHNYPVNCVVYTGTHDNDTARGWYERVAQNSKKFYLGYLNSDGSNVAWDMIRACWASVAFLSLAPMQDFLDLGNEARMNYPGDPSGNWKWRMQDGAFDSQLRKKIKEINFLFNRTDPKIVVEDNTPKST